MKRNKNDINGLNKLKRRNKLSVRIKRNFLFELDIHSYFGDESMNSSKIKRICSINKSK